MAYGIRVISVLLVSFQFVFALQTAAATSLPHQLYGKSVTISRAIEDVYQDETTGKMITFHAQLTDNFYFSSQGRIFARRLNRNQFGSRTFEQVGSDPNKGQRATDAAGRGQSPSGTGVATFQDLHFEGRTLVAIYKLGENGANRLAIEFDQNFGACSVSLLHGTDNGKPRRQISWTGHVLRNITAHRTSEPSCVVRDGNIFE
jgi:hypothetical protein